jgi:hypothetical protein
MLSVTLRFAPNQKPAQNLTMSGRTQKKPAKSGRDLESPAGKMLGQLSN